MLKVWEQQKEKKVKKKKGIQIPSEQQNCMGSASVLTHALGYWVRNHIPSSIVSLQFRLSLQIQLQLLHHAAELCIRNCSFFEKWKHQLFVRLYEFPMSHIRTVPLQNHTTYANIVRATGSGKARVRTSINMTRRNSLAQIKA